MASVVSTSAHQVNRMEYHADSSSHVRCLSTEINAALGPSNDEEDDYIIKILSGDEEED